MLSLGVAVGLTVAHGSIGQPDDLIRLATLAVIAGLAVVGARLRREVGSLVQALDALPDAVTIQDPDGQVLYGNHAARRLAGQPDGLSAGSADDYLRRMVVTDEAGAPLVPEHMPSQRLLAGV